MTSVPSSSTLTFLSQEKAGDVGHVQFVYSPGLAFRLFLQYYRKRGSTSYIVREVHSVREREREIQRKTEVTSPVSR